MAKESKPEVTLADIQALVKVPKSNRNEFGKYNFRSASDILEIVKPIVNPLGFFVTLGDEIVSVGGSNYVKATATLSNGTQVYSESALAREGVEQKGMQDAQITGSTSSYARKYALSGLFAIDDTKDPDATNDHGQAKKDVPKTPEKPKQELKKTEAKADSSTSVLPERKVLTKESVNWLPTVEKLKKGLTMDIVEKFYILADKDKAELISYIPEKK